jgi:N-acetyl sugar amidotransferase
MNNSTIGLPTEVVFCKRCTISNQRPSTSVEFRNTANTAKQFIDFDSEGICDACRYADIKKGIDWNERERELVELLNRFRSSDGSHDILVPGSGGKDSIMTAHMLKQKYGMHPLLVTWPPILPTSIGRRNFQAWLDLGFSNFTVYPNQLVNRYLTRLAFKNLLHPFQPFTIGQKNLAPKIATLLNIPLVMYGENESEYGSNIRSTYKSQRDVASYVGSRNLSDLFLGGVSVEQLIADTDFHKSDFEAYLPIDMDQVDEKGIEFHYLGYFVEWHPQSVYYYAVEHSGFEPNEFRTEGSYSKYSSIDDKLDWLHYYCRYIKFGQGRATSDTAQEVRNGDITRDEGVRLIKRFDGEPPRIYQQEILEFMEMSNSEFIETIDNFRPPHLWERVNSGWRLKHPIWEDHISSK